MTPPQNPPKVSATAFLERQMARLGAHLCLVAPGHGFLQELAAPIYGNAVGNPDALRARLASTSEATNENLAALAPAFPLAALVSAYGLSRLEADLLTLALLPELDDRFGDVFASLHGGLGARRPTLGIALRALFSSHATRWEARRHLETTPLWEAGLFRSVPNGAVDGFERFGLDTVLLPSAPVIAAAFGQLPSRLDGGAELRLTHPSPDSKDLRAGLAPLVAEIGRWIEAVQIGVVHLACENPGDGVAMAEALATAFDRGLLWVSNVAKDPAITLRQAAQCGHFAAGLLAVDLAGVDAISVPASFRLPGPALLVSSGRTEVRLPEGLTARRILVSRPRPIEQAALWRSALGEGESDVRVDVLANRTTLSAAQVRIIAARAAERARADGRPRARHEDVVDAIAEAVADPSSSLARISRPDIPWSKLVLDRETRIHVDDLVNRVEHRVTVQDAWGLSGAEGRGEGIVAMFHGESGTGKTLAAEAIAAKIGLPLWRVDLSRVVSKYIGETEKQLSVLFDGAEGFRALLFFDEADTLFSRRTGVRDAHDRYANLETNYLLSRLEAFEGIAVLATNFLQNVDTAFMRRLSFVIPFPRPTAAQRQRLWGMHLPKLPLGEDADIDAVAAQHDLTGGEIRSAALSAAYAAAAASTKITAELIDVAIRAERIKAGKAVRR